MYDSDSGQQKIIPNMNHMPPHAAEIWVLKTVHKITEPHLTHLGKEGTGLDAFWPPF